ncbi:hypothetical protein K2173_012827 [Erythroxylum novogranatense]|uniref:ACT domain-containing protein ACR n=1 Tax=Erythroxylum novogranatense TaxID=1862640 RepID=A0AAV8S5P3_9ROSI|nr:hypothetical protein K2173_012827 [Erythroxylum novogranatense]
MSTHSVSSLDVVLVEEAKVPGDPSVVTVNCPDKAGLGCDLCRIILEFGLRISQADFSTDGRWCYMVFWVVPYSVTHIIRWESLKNRLFYASPSCLGSLCFDQRHSDPSPNALYLLKFCCLDRKGLLYEVTKVISELDFTIEKVKVMSTPDGRVVDLFFITDGMGLLHSKERRDDTFSCLINLFSKYCISFELQLAGPEYESFQAFSSLPPAVAEELFSCGQLEKESDKNTLEKDKTTLSKVSITVDNLLSQAHTLLQIQCVDQKGLFYDILRISKDFNIRIAYGRFASSVKGSRNMDLFIQLNDGRKVLDTKFQLHLCSRLEEEMLNPLRVIIANRGPDTELLVANPVELCGKGRPRVFYDVTLALKKLRICVLLAEIGRHSTHNREWEVYRFLLDENCKFSLDCNQARNHILDKVKRTLMGW